MRKYFATVFWLALALFNIRLKATAQCPFSQLYNSDAIDYAFAKAQSPVDNLNSLNKVPEDSFQCAAPPSNCLNHNDNYYYRTHDGSCNNLNNSGFGMANSRYSRILVPRYSDGVYRPTVSITGSKLPSARQISLALFGEQTLPDSYRTLAALFWGQFVAHDLSRFTNWGSPDDCCTDENINNKRCDPIFLAPNGPISSVSGRTCWSFARGTTDFDAGCSRNKMTYTEKITTTTAFLDLSSIYGNSQSQNRRVRQFSGGLLKTSSFNNRLWIPISFNKNGECGENYQCYDTPDSRNQILPTIAVLHTVLLREHNRIANALSKINPHYSDERLYQESRKINIAQYQKITFYDWLPLIIGPAYAYWNNLIYHINENDYVDDYDVTINAAPYAEYSAAAFRYIHNQVPGWFSLVSQHRDYNQTFRLSDYMERPENINFLSEGNNFDSLIRGLVTQLQKRSDVNIDGELKHYFGRKTFEQFGEDLKTRDIQRGRDFGLPSYNDIRHYCGLQRAIEWTHFSNEISSDKIAIMQRFYATPDDVDVSVGGALEFHAPESIFGPTFQCVVAKQFLKTRRGDRFFFERSDIFSGFTRDQLIEVRKSSLSTIFCNNADYLQLIQPNSFVIPGLRNGLSACRSLPRVDLSKWTSSS